MEWKTTETNLLFHIKGIMFNMNEHTVFVYENVY